MMKLLVLLLIVLAVAWLLGAPARRLRARREDAAVPPAAAGAPPPSQPDRIVSCARCGLHLPRGEAVAGRDGSSFYCSETHRLLHEPAPPPAA